MSTVWAIKGLGFDLDSLKLDYVSILDKVDTDWVQTALDEGDIEFEELEAWLNGTPNDIQAYAEELGRVYFEEKYFQGTCNAIFGREDLLEYVNDGGDKQYLLFPALLPYQIPTDVVNLSKEDLVNLIIKMVKPYTNQSEEEMLELIDDINAYGVG